MATTLDIVKRFEGLNVDTVSQEAMEQVTTPLKEKQKDQLLSGLNRMGEQIGKYRSPAYAKKKYAMNPLPGEGIPDLKLTGAFHREVYAEVRGDKVIVDSTNDKTQALVNKYGEKIFGLNTEKKIEFIKEDLKPAFIREIKKTLKL